MKKIFEAALAFIMLFSLEGCGHKTDADGNIPPSQSIINSDSDNEKSKSTGSKEKSSIVESSSVKDVRIKLIFGDEEVIVTMYDNPTSRDLLSQLPLTLNFKDYAGEEKIAYPPKILSTEDAPSGANPKLGDLALYSPWGNLVIYYGDSKYADGLIILGHIESGIEKFSKMDQKFTVTIERMN